VTPRSRNGEGPRQPGTVPPDPPPELVAEAILSVLNRHGVRYVVIGAFAAIAQQAPIPPTRDIDLTPENSRVNLNRLSAALTELGARIRTESVPEGVPFAHDGASLKSAVAWNLICAYGEFDLSLQPSGFTNAYEELSAHALLLRVGGVEVQVASLDDVIRSKEATGRAKDLRVLPILHRFRSATTTE